METIKNFLNMEFDQARNIVFLILIIGLFMNIQRIYPDLRRKLDVIDPTNTQAFIPQKDKLRVKIGWGLYDYAEFIKRELPEDARILVPPQGFPWPATGNVAYFRYFLYPRHLVNGAEREVKVDLKNEGIEYVLLAWGETDGTEYDYTHGWPKFPLPAKAIIYKKDLTHVGNYESVVIEKDYDPKDPMNEKNWGIIVLDRERL